MFSPLTESLRYCFRCGARLPGVVPTRCSQCGLGHYANPKACAGALVVVDGQVALVRRAIDPYQDHWDIPGGFADVGEHPAQTAVREVREELGWDVTVTGYLGTWVDTYDDPAASITFPTLNTYYSAALNGDPDEPSDPEILEHAFFPIAEPPERLAFPHHIGPVLAALRNAYSEMRLDTALYDLERGRLDR